MVRSEMFENMDTSTKIRFGFIALLWLALCYIVVVSQPFTLRVAFIIVASGIIVWVPLYKKYIRNGKRETTSTEPLKATTVKAGPLLGKIESPSDLRKLSVEELPQVCAEIRDFLIQSLSVNPGHFASSMGAVEITVALHYVFNTPYDRIVWDVGHQAYGHKLLTGRRDSFAGNRKLGGLSGFPNPDESEYDTFVAGHASNSISAALGMAVATSLKKEDPERNVIAVIGDASISGGLAFEGLNNAANSNSNLLIILNDNDMSIDHNVGSLNSYLAHLTTSKGYNNFRYKIYRRLKRWGLVTEKGRGKILRFNNSLKSLLTDGRNIFEGLNIRYFGPFDGHDVGRIVGVLNDIKDMKGPRILHLCTVKGKGFGPAERIRHHGMRPDCLIPEAERKSAEKVNCPNIRTFLGKCLWILPKKTIGLQASQPPCSRARRCRCWQRHSQKGLSTWVFRKVMP